MVSGGLVGRMMFLGALTQGRTLKEAKENLIDAVREIKKTDNISFIPKKEIIVEEIEV
jgi:hypothetical protein